MVLTVLVGVNRNQNWGSGRFRQKRAASRPHRLRNLEHRGGKEAMEYPGFKPAPCPNTQGDGKVGVWEADGSSLGPRGQPVGARGLRETQVSS